MWVRAAVRGVLVGLCAVVAIAAQARADLPTADVAFRIRTQGQAAVNRIALVEIERHSYGPQPTTTGFLSMEIRAPGGTVFDPTFERSLGRGYYDCQWFTPHRHFRCKLDGMLYPDDDNPSGTTTFYVWKVSLVVKARCTTPGSAKIIYAGDPKTSNNSVTLRVTVPGVPASECTTKPSPKPTPAPSSTPTPIAATATASPEPSTFASTTATPLPTPALGEEAATALVPTMVAIGGGVAATAIGLGAIVWWLRRSQRQGASE